VNLRVSSDLTIEGQYSLEGQALNVMPVTGEGDFTIDLDGCTLSAISYIGLHKDQHGIERDAKRSSRR